ncbi:MAG: hypothetical protein H0V17_02115 [Deltaproteobacteria bacterium]|nr:hypothetical protein [Deltaproteobacteria bacterium]
MAPEQFCGVATPASDQYAFCAALWEVLAREPLFETASLHEPHLDARRYRPLPRHLRVPSEIERAIERGLSPDPEDRFPAITELLTALTPARRTWRMVGAGVALLAIAVGGMELRRDSMIAEAAVAPEPVIAPSNRPDQTQIRALTQLGPDACAYAPAITGDQIVFDRTDEHAVDLYAIALAGGTPRQLTSDAPWEWRAQPGRRDGEVLHLIHDPKRHAGAAIAFLDVASGKSTRALDTLANDAVAIGDAVFYIPNNHHELRRSIAGRDEVFAVPPRNGDFVTLAASPTGDRLATQGRDQLCTIDTATGERDCFPVRATSRPAFGVDGRALYYSGRDGIHRIDLRDRRDELILPEALAGGGLAVARDGSTLIYSACGAHARLVEYGASQRVLVDGPSVMFPATSRQGDLAWVQLQRGAMVLMLRTVDGRQIQLTHPDLGNVYSPAFSPDGERLTFAVAGTHPGIHVIRRASGSAPTSTMFAESIAQRLTDDATDQRPIWTTTDTIVFTRTDGRTPATYAIPSDGGTSRKLAVGRTVIGSRGAEVLVRSERAMYWLDTVTGVERPGPGTSRSATFRTLSPNGDWMTFSIGGAVGHMLWRQRTTPGARAERVAELPTGQTIRELAITDDGCVLGTPSSWSGDLFAVPAPTGTRF